MLPHCGPVPTIIRAEAEARKLVLTGESALAGGVMYWLLTNGHAIGYDYSARRYRYRSVAGNHIPLRPFVTARPQARPTLVPVRARNGTARTA